MAHIDRRQWLRFTLASLCFMLVMSACQNSVNNVVTKPTATKAALNTTSSGTPFTVQVAQQGGATPTVKPTPKPTATIPSSPPVQAPSGSGYIPGIFPHYFSFGVMNAYGDASQLDAQRSQNGTAYAFRYQYLSGGVNTGHDWTTWDQPPGQFSTNYMLESVQHGYLPAFVYYEICQSNGAQPGSYCSGHDNQQDPSNLQNSSVMNAYYANWALLMQHIGAFGKPVLIIVEPDLWGFLEQNSPGSTTAANIPASVKSSGYADAAGFPDTAQGFGWALLHIRDKYARNAVLALHASSWAAGPDIASDTSSSLDVAGVARTEASFLNSLGITGNPAGVSTWDLLSNDVADHDSGQPGSHGWWDRYNRTFPNFARYLTYISLLTQDVHRRVVMWQVPIGNQYFDTMNNSAGHYQDNRAEYILNNVASFGKAGIVGVLFGPGNGGTMNVDSTGDGVTNPASISTYECNYCNNHTSSYPDDDGGYLRIFIGQYMQHPTYIS